MDDQATENARNQAARRAGRIEAGQMARQIVEDLAEAWEMRVHDHGEAASLTKAGQLVATAEYEPRRLWGAIDAPRDLVETLETFGWEVADE